MKTKENQSQNLQKAALTNNESDNQELVNVPKRRTILRRNRNRQHSNRYWQDMKEDPL